MNRILCLAALMAWAGTTLAADWPRWRGPERNAISRETGLLKSWPAGGPKVAWQIPLGAGASSFAIVGDRVYTMYQDATTQFGVCLDAANGKTVWSVPLGASYKKSATGPRATPTVEGDKVYFIDALGNLACVSAADGKPAWKINTLELAGSKIGKKNIPWAVANSPFIIGDVIIVNPGIDEANSQSASVMAIDKKTGNVVWKALNFVAGYSTPMEMNVGGTEMLALLTGDAVIGFSPKDGKLLWDYTWPNEKKINIPSVIVDGDKVFATTGYGIGCVTLQIVPAGEGKFTAKELYPISKDMQCRYGNPVLVDGYIYGFNEKKLTCIDPKTGKASWTQDGFGYGALSYAEGLFYIHGEQGNLALCKLTPEKCEIISEIPKILGGKEARWAMPTIANGKLYVRDEKEVVCYDIKGQ